MTVCLVLLTCTGTALGQFEPNDDFGSRAVLDPSVRTVSDSLTAGAPGGGPDTTLGAFTAAGSLIEYNDDGSPYGDGYASALYDVSVNADGSIRLKVSGAQDYDFDGSDDYWGTPHEQAGPYDLYVTVFDSGDVQIGSHALNGTLTAGGVLSHTLSGYGYGASDYFQALIDNTPGGAEDRMDWMTFTGLSAGAHFEARTVAVAGQFDTVLGWFDNDGVVIEYDDDGAGGLFSRIGGTVPGDGKLNLTVTGYADFLFQGDHSQSGNYTLELLLPPGGDANLDGMVDGLDYNTWSLNYLMEEMLWIEGDFNDDGVIDGLDYNLWSLNYHYGYPEGAAVPEPVTAVLLVPAGLMAALRRRRRGAREVRP
ncbi:MAG: hypothetical protein AMJ81_12595 [Phycisphaerae bacterium SM23_33]|nr:MAG: hypothetical protein AMJ81_12595 [Phycisphaerae bacterium SM23_33]